MTEPYKIHVKLGQNEFNAEGPKDSVAEQYAMFLAAIKESVVVPPVPLPSIPPPLVGGNGGRAPQVEIDPETLARVFMVDPEGQVSLRMLPQSQQRDSDGVLVLLYGFRAMSNQADVLSGRLLSAAQTSGLNVDRVDRALAPFMDLITKGGVRAGSRWGLRNTGVSRAQEIIRGMVS